MLILNINYLELNWRHMRLCCVVHNVKHLIWLVNDSFSEFYYQRDDLIANLCNRINKNGLFILLIKWGMKILAKKKEKKLIPNRLGWYQHKTICCFWRWPHRENMFNLLNNHRLVFYDQNVFGINEWRKKEKTEYGNRKSKRSKKNEKEEIKWQH